MVHNLLFTLNQVREKQKAEKVVRPMHDIKATPLGTGHRKIEGVATIFTVLALLAILVASVFSVAPILSMHRWVKPEAQTEPYTPLELAGRDIYIHEGCYVCHSQQIRKLPDDVVRYGAPSTVEESMYDRPFQWGSKRTGPDLARVGGKYPDLWHYRHMLNPRDLVGMSIMPGYSWLLKKNTDFYSLRKKLSVMKYLGVPYSDDVVGRADILAEGEAARIAEGLRGQGIVDDRLEQREIVALIAYLQALGKKAGLAGQAGASGAAALSAGSPQVGDGGGSRAPGE
jgi:cytochrome c oxidase cbb3-type subunit I/II